MGDYLRNGVKIGTCGSAYYATKSMLEAVKSDPEAAYYLDPKNKCNFAFPFPEYDGKKVGEISNFHAGRAEFFFEFAGDAYHQDICTHLHPRGGAGINLFHPCPYNGGRSSANFKNVPTWRLSRQVNIDGRLHIMAECIYCEAPNYFSKEEAATVCEWIETRKHSTEESRLYYLEIAKRIKQTYNESN